MKPLDLHPDAREELVAIVDWYRSHDARIGARVVGEIGRVFEAIREAPSASPEVEGRVRRRLLRGFPFAVFFRVDASSILVVAVAHHAREPGYWRSRSSSEDSTLHDRGAEAAER